MSIRAAVEPAGASRKPLLRGWLHLVAFAGTAVAGPLLVARAPSGGARLALSVYVASLALLFGVSATYHRRNWQPVARRRLRRLDHSTIFIAIAGTYSAVATLALRGLSRPAIIVFVWVGALAGIGMRQLWLDAPKWAIALPYVVLGWCAAAVLPGLEAGLGPAGLALLLAGGVFYSAGAAVYALRRPDPVPSVFGYHEVFHACTIVGAGLQFAAIAAFALGRG